ncbi:MAG TPA: hypothetical protein VK627_10970 [Edaphobacter sp.]|nr:hypothetical protein [Edaphobacter sp.]
MKLFAWLEAYGLAGCDGDFGAGPGIAPNTGFSGFHCEHTEAAQFDTVARNEGLFHAFEDGVYRCLCFRSRQSSALNNPLYKILLNHVGRRPWALTLGKDKY